MSIRELVREMHVRLLAGYPADAVVRAAVVAEAALKQVLGRAPDAKGMLGELIGEAARTSAKERVGGDLLRDLDWLNRKRIEAVHFTGEVRADLIDDGQRAVDIATRVVLLAGLSGEIDLADLRRQAEWDASEPASTAVLRLDRAAQRKGLDDLLGSQRRVLVLFVDGEVGQGHDHFGEVTWWRLRAVPKGQWRETRVEWPAPSPSLGTRLGFLLEGLAAAVNAPLVAPADDPSTPAGEAAWAPALLPVLAAIDAGRERAFLRHVLGWLDDGDAELVARYVRMVWTPLAARRGERVVVALDARRVEGAGFPLSKVWRTSRSERAAARAIAARLEDLEMPAGGHCAALAELTSVPPADLVDWLRTERGRGRSAAETEATELVATTRGGRFELLAQRLSSLNLDRRNPK